MAATTANVDKLSAQVQAMCDSVVRVEQWRPTVDAHLTDLKTVVEGLGARISHLEVSPSHAYPIIPRPNGHRDEIEYQGDASRANLAPG